MTNDTISWDDAVAQVCGPGSRYEITEIDLHGRTTPVFANAPGNLGMVYLAPLVQPPNNPMLVYEDEVVTIGEFNAAVTAAAVGLIEQFGVQKGDRVALAMRNYPEWVIAAAAATTVGAVVVAMNAWWTTEELEYGLVDSGSTVLIADSERIERALPVLDKVGCRGIGVRLLKPVDGIVSWADLVADTTSVRPTVEVGPDDDATILYTSGTTGHPKGAVSTHRAVVNALMSFGARALVNDLIGGTDTLGEAGGPDEAGASNPPGFLLAVPLFHVTGLVPVMLSAVASGRKLVMMRKWEPARALELIERERPTIFVGVPTMSWDLLECPDFAHRDTSSLQNIGGGGAPAPRELVARVEKAYRGRPSIGYGMTETNAYGPQNAGDDYQRKPDSSGRAVPTMQVKVIDEAGNTLPTGEIGEICFFGPTLIRGYWNKPEATADTFVDGWLRSGDLGLLDEEGFIFVRDRAKDMVLRGGENIYCAEVEAVIYEHPAVYEAAVFGVTHERLGEELACAVVVRNGIELDPSELAAHIGAHLAAFKVPSIIDLRSEQLPRGATGKILKRQIREEFEARSAS